jgi:hypothetical protein
MNNEDTKKTICGVPNKIENLVSNIQPISNDDPSFPLLISSYISTYAS